MKNCINCQHWSFDGGWPETETDTGEGWSCECCVDADDYILSHWQLEGADITADDWRRWTARAETCRDYEAK